MEDLYVQYVNFHSFIHSFIHLFIRSFICEQVTRLLEELLKEKDHSDNLTKCEGRALPLRGAQLDHLRKQNQHRVQGDGKDKGAEKSQEKASEKETTSSTKKSPQRQLYEILLGPVEDILMKVSLKWWWWSGCMFHSDEGEFEVVVVSMLMKESLKWWWWSGCMFHSDEGEFKVVVVVRVYVLF